MIPIYYDEKSLTMIPSRKADSNKGDFGHVLIVAGSRGMSGAAYMSAIAAYRTGAGLVKIFTVEYNRIIIGTLLPEAIISTYSPQEVLSGDDKWIEKLRSVLTWADVIVMGPGLGQEPYALKLTEDILEYRHVTTIIDADCLNMISSHAYLTKYYSRNIIITPHIGEMVRLTGKAKNEIMDDMLMVARQYSDMHGINCVLKSYKPVIATADGRIYINTSGTPALAKAGTGDILTGIIAGMLCLGLDEGTATALGTYIHGLAGREAEKIYGEHGVLARDVIEAIPKVMQRGRQLEKQV